MFQEVIKQDSIEYVQLECTNVHMTECSFTKAFGLMIHSAR